MKSRANAAGIFVLVLAAASPAIGAPRSTKASPSASAAGNAMATGLRSHVGTEIVMRLLRSSEADQRLRGIERLTAMNTAEAFAMLERTTRAAVPGALDPRASIEGIARKDARALLVAVRALARWADREQARAALASIVRDPSQLFETRVATAPGHDPSAEDAEGAARVLLARQEAAMALAQSGNVLAIEVLIAIARSAGPGQGPALDALAVHPPAPPLLGGVVLTTPATIALAASVGDLRAVDAIEGAMSASDPALRAAALVALAVGGDLRIADAARSGLRDRDARVRLAAGDALVRLGAPDAARAIEELVGDDATALDALRLAELVQGEGVTKAAAARAIATANPDIRTAALAALGRQTSPLAISALATLVTDPFMQGDAACAMARSPSPAAMTAIENMAGNAALQRLAGRAYFVRRWVRSERRAQLDALLDRLAASSDARDRAVGIQALVALGLRALEQGLADPDPRVRRAAAMGALPLWGATNRTALLRHLIVEPDSATREVLALGLRDGDVDRVIPTLDLLARAHEGGADAAISSLALAQRAEERNAREVDAMLESYDPVLRVHVARGLGANAAHETVSRLSRAYATEGDVQVRRAIVAALSMRSGEDASAAELRATLELAATLDPDRIVRWTASRTLSGRTAVSRPAVREVAWLRLSPADGATLPRNMTAALVQSDGIALPIAFDDDGYALLPGVPPGEARLRLASRPASYEAASP
jgi:HEAT repeat protein